MARRKSDAEVGPLGVWAYNTRTALDLSVEAVIAALPTHYHPATLRKVESGASKPGARMWRELAALYAKMAEAGSVQLEPQPRLAPEPAGATETPDALVEAIGALVAEMRAQREAQREEGSALLRFAEAVAQLAQQRTAVEA